jgi:hypothetical protein
MRQKLKNSCRVLGGKGGSLYRCTGKSLSLAVNLYCVRHTEAGEHQFDVCMALHLAWMPQVGTGLSEKFFFFKPPIRVDQLKIFTLNWKDCQLQSDLALV